VPYPRLARWVALLLSLLLLANCGKAPPRLAPLTEDSVILAFGDSLTYGTGAGPGESYPEVLSALIGREVINAGVPGQRSDQGRERLPRLLEQHSPDLVLLCYGGNDFLQQTGEAQAAANIAEMVQLARGQGAEVVLIGVPKPGLWLASADFYGEIARRFNLPYVDSTLPAILSDGALKSDAVHPNAAGYRRLAEAIAELLKAGGALD
jgi:lysophospholipase L1-like esterase